MSCMAHFPSCRACSAIHVFRAKVCKRRDAGTSPGMTENPYFAGLAADGAPAEAVVAAVASFHDSYGENGALLETSSGIASEAWLSTSGGVRRPR